MTHWSISSIVLTQEAESLWLEVEIISEDKNLFYIKWNWKEVLFKSTDFWLNSSLWLKIANDKELTNNVLDYHSLPTAQSFYVLPEEIDTIDNLKLKFPVIVKPLEEWHGNGVIMNIQSKEELKEKLKESFESYNKMIIQRQIEWEEYRVLVLGDEILVAVNREAASVIWNWIDTIEKLINKENNNPLRAESYSSPLSKIVIDNELKDYLDLISLDISKIPKSWDKIQLRPNSNIWSGWIYNNVTNIMSDSIKSDCIKATKALGLVMWWIDIITTDLTQSLDETNGIILEVNATPWIWGLTSIEGTDIPNKILKSLFFNE